MNTKVSFGKLLLRALLTALVTLVIYLTLYYVVGIPRIWSNVFMIIGCLVPGTRYIFDASYRNTIAGKAYYVIYEISIIILSYYVLMIIAAIIVSALFGN